jgi:hypothetical protein
MRIRIRILLFSFDPGSCISESLEKILGLKILKLFDADPGSRIYLPWIRDGKIRIRDPG